MILVANSYLAVLIYAIEILSTSVMTLHNNLKQIQYYHSLCIFRGYLTWVSCALYNYSFLLQAFYRSMIVIHPTHLF